MSTELDLEQRRRRRREAKVGNMVRNQEKKRQDKRKGDENLRTTIGGGRIHGYANGGGRIHGYANFDNKQVERKQTTMFKEGDDEASEKKERAMAAHKVWKMKCLQMVVGEFMAIQLQR